MASLIKGEKMKTKVSNIESKKSDRTIAVEEAFKL